MFIHQNVLIDPRVDYLRSVDLLAPMRYLLRAPPLADQSFDQDPGGDFYAIPGFLTSVQSKPMSLLGSIAFQSVIAPDLVSDCGYMNLDKAGNIRLVVSCFISAYRRVYSVKISYLFRRSSKLRVGSHTVPVLYRCECSFDVVV